MKVLNAQEKPMGESARTGANKLTDEENGRRP